MAAFSRRRNTQQNSFNVYVCLRQNSSNIHNSIWHLLSRRFYAVSRINSVNVQAVSIHSNVAYHDTPMVRSVELTRLKMILQLYDSHSLILKNIKITSVLNDFIYLLTHHGKEDEKYEYMYNVFGGKCDVKCCKIFRRNYMCRNTLKRCDALLVHRYCKTFPNHIQTLIMAYIHSNTVEQQIIDKIHCYFRHSYDIGYRLTAKDKESINNFNVSENGQKTEERLLKPRLLRLNQILSLRRKQFKIPNINNVHNAQKFNQLQPLILANDKMYSFGYEFQYGMNDTNCSRNSKLISAKYSDLKQEILSNSIYRLGMSQFDTEYSKAVVHYRSDYCRTNYATMQKENVFTLMLYCNFTELQYNLTKTYRDDGGSKHYNFFHWASMLKHTIHTFGSNMYDTKRFGDKLFYHGIGEQLLFPEVIGVAGCGVRIHSPLSTSSSFSVATNFTNFNNGLIVEFGCNGMTSGASKYFSVSWLSNYANENEYLFVQNKGDLEINNIFDVSNGYEYECILKALKIIDVITDGHSAAIAFKEPYKMINLVQRILAQQLSLKYGSFFSNFRGYSQKLIDTFCRNKKEILFNYFHFKGKFDKLYSFFANSTHIRLDIINDVFVNLETIEIHGINLCEKLLEHIWNHFAKKDTKLTSVEIYPDDYSRLELPYALKMYQKLFIAIGVQMQIEEDNQIHNEWGASEHWHLSHFQYLRFEKYNFNS